MTDVERALQRNMRVNLMFLEEFINAEKAFQEMPKHGMQNYFSLTKCLVQPRCVFDGITDVKVQPGDRAKWDKFKAVYKAGFKQHDKVNEVARRARDFIIQQKLGSEKSKSICQALHRSERAEQ